MCKWLYVLMIINVCINTFIHLDTFIQLDYVFQNAQLFQMKWVHLEENTLAFQQSQYSFIIVTIVYFTYTNDM